MVTPETGEETPGEKVGLQLDACHISATLFVSPICLIIRGAYSELYIYSSSPVNLDSEHDESGNE